MIILCNCTLPDGGSVRPETCRSLRIEKHHSGGNEVCAFIGLYGNSCYECSLALLV